MADIKLSPAGQVYREEIDGITRKLWEEYGPNITGFGGYVNVPGRPDNYILATSANALEREQAIIDGLKWIEANKDPETGEFESEEDKTAYNALLKGLQDLNEVREKARDSGLEEDQITLASALRGTLGDKDLSDSQLSRYGARATKTKTESSAIATASEEERKALLTDDSELSDEEKASTVKIAYQCFLMYNLEYFSSIHKGLLVSDVNNKGYNAPVDKVIQTTGYIKKDETPRIYLSEESQESSAMVNKLKICPGNEEFSRIKTHEYAQLMPLLRIYKVYRNRRDFSDEIGLVEMEFDARTNRDGIEKVLEMNRPVGGLEKRYSKGTSCGVVSFDWNFIGSDTFTATRDIDATLKLFFQDLSELTRERKNKDLISGDDKNKPYKYLDLIVLPDCRDTRQRYNSSFSPECYEIRVDVGYALQGNTHNFRQSLKDSICCQRDSLYLTPVDHGFEFGEDGTVQLTINYKGRIENIMNDRKFNVLMPGGGFYDIKFKNSKGAMTSIQKIEDDILVEEDKKRPNKERIASLRRERNIFFLNYSQIFYNQVLRHMNDLGYVHSKEISSSDYYKFSKWRTGEASSILPPPLTRRTGATADVGSVDSALLDLTDAATVSPEDDAGDKVEEGLKLEDVNQRLINAMNGSKHIINYFFLGDLFGVITSTVFGDYFFDSATDSSGDTISLTYNETLSSSVKDIIDNFHLILGNTTLTIGETEYIVNLAHIPVSLNIFQEFMIKNVIGQDITFYSYAEFLDDFIGYAVTQVLGDCFEGSFKGDSRTSTALFTTQSGLSDGVFQAERDEQFKNIKFSKMHPDSLVAFDLCKKDSIKQRIPKDYLVIDTINQYPRDLAGTLKPGVRGDPIGDRARGIYHFALGQTDGLVKKAKFSKTDQEFLPEARYASGDGFTFNQLSNVYDATFEMVGNNLFKNGMFIYFESAPIGAGFPWERVEDRDGEIIKQSWANIMGLGGYHLVTEVNHSIRPGSYVTSVKARWVTGGQGIVDELVVTNSEITEAQQQFDGYEAALNATVLALGNVPEDQRDGHPLKDELNRLQKEYDNAGKRLRELKDGPQRQNLEETNNAGV